MAGMWDPPTERARMQGPKMVCLEFLLLTSEIYKRKVHRFQYPLIQIANPHFQLECHPGFSPSPQQLDCHLDQ